VIAIMNSKLMKYWLMKNCKQKGAMFELIAEPLSKMPIKPYRRMNNMNLRT